MLLSRHAIGGGLIWMPAITIVIGAVSETWPAANKGAGEAGFLGSKICEGIVGVIDWMGQGNMYIHRADVVEDGGR